jgi:AcrR family transcriptional regulator
MAQRAVRRHTDRETRQKAILDAALDVFAEKGFDAARLDDVAARAGVAKGTIYLYAPSKQALFEALVRQAIVVPVAEASAALFAQDLGTEALLRALLTFFRVEVLGTRRREIAWLVLTEAPRRPELARFYHDEVASKGVALIRTVAERGIARGELASDALVRFPQLAVAPALASLLWNRLFGAFDPLDVEGLLDTHLEILMRALRRPS